MRDTRGFASSKKNIGFARWQIHLGTVLAKDGSTETSLPEQGWGPVFGTNFGAHFRPRFLYLYYSRPQIGDLKND